MAEPLRVCYSQNVPREEPGKDQADAGSSNKKKETVMINLTEMERTILEAARKGSREEAVIRRKLEYPPPPRKPQDGPLPTKPETT